jgi:hypothetical protein
LKKITKNQLKLVMANKFRPIVLALLGAACLSSCSLSAPSVIPENLIPEELEATEITFSSLDWAGYFVPGCPQAESYASDLREKTELVEGVSYVAPSLTAWRVVHIIFETQSAIDAEELALGFADVMPCIGVPSALVAPIPVSSFGTDLKGTAFSQVTDLSVLGSVEGVKTVVADGKYLIYIDAYGHETSGYDVPRLSELVKVAIS